MQLLNCTQRGFTSCGHGRNVMTAALKALRYICGNNGFIFNDAD